jgi:hypothetical protein
VSLTNQQQKGGLEGIVGIDTVAECRPTDPEHHGAKSVNERAEGLFVARVQKSG